MTIPTATKRVVSKESLWPDLGDLHNKFDSGSFRDRSARVFLYEENVFRALSEEGFCDWQKASACKFFQAAMLNGQIVETRVVKAASEAKAGNDDGRWRAVLRHQRLPVITYPYEWSFSMLRDAALLTLNLLRQAIDEDIILKDATPYNVQFCGASPIFIDTSSFASLRPGQAWEGYKQFCQQFLYPLMLQSFRNADFQPILRGRMEGISPRQMSGQLSFRDMFRRGVFSHVWLHARLNRADTSRSAGSMQSGVAKSLAESGFQKSTILNNIDGLLRIVNGLKWQATESRWVQYDKLSAPVQNDGNVKEKHIEQIVSSRHWGHVWDLGCNLGRYSRIAARHADYVLAMDSDHLTVERLYQSIADEKITNITPLVFNLADPSPGLGWNGNERKILANRSKPDLVLSLAVIHHLVIGENLLLDDVVQWLASLGASLVIEFVDRTDPQVKSLLANRADQFPDYTRENFERLMRKHFYAQQSWDLPSGTRTLFFAQSPVNGN